MNFSARSIRRGRKFDQVLAGARKVFLRDGFEGASVDEIAREAGVSKATLYNYFPDKQRLFSEVARTECQRMADETLELIDTSQGPRRVLFEAAVRITSFMLSPFSQRIFRICVAEADRFPELGRMFYESGPELGRMQLTLYLREAVEQGGLAIEDFDLAADQFAELCKATLWTQAIFGIRGEFSRDEVEHVAQGAVDTFMARYGTA